MPTIGRAVLHVSDLDAAIDFYSRGFGFEVIYDEEIFAGFRSVHVGPATTTDPGLWLFPSDHVSDREVIRVVLYSDDIQADAGRLTEAGARIVRPLSGAPGERSLQVSDAWGNITVLAERPV